MRPEIAVACGVLRKANGEVLIAQRPAGKIAAGKWEFPGGKIERGEDVEAALRRELQEELGVSVSAARPLIRVVHDYSDRRVVLDTWLVSSWSGEIHGREQQAIAWVRPPDLGRYDLLAADAPIVTALTLPPHYVFTSPVADQNAIREGVNELPQPALLRLRLPGMTERDYEALALAVLPAARLRGLRLILDRDPAMVLRVGADGWHATSTVLASLRLRPPGLKLFLASCHNDQEVALARQLSADAAVIGPVLATASHPGAGVLAWPGFADLARQANFPVYAIGGLRPTDAEIAQQHCGQGVAGISAYWRARVK